MVKFFKKLFLRKIGDGRQVLGFLRGGQPMYAYGPRVCGAPTDDMRRRISAVRQRQYREFLEHFPFPIYGNPPFRARGTLPVSMSKTRVLWCLEKIEACCGGNRFADGREKMFQMGTRWAPTDPLTRADV